MQDRAAWAALWWAIASCGLGVGVATLALHGFVPAFASDVAAPLLLDVCAPLTWTAACIFNRGSIRPYPLLAGVAAWLATLALTGAYAGEQPAIALGVGVSAGFYAGAALEFWLGRRERLRGRTAMIPLLGLYSVALFLAAIQYYIFDVYVPTLSVNWLGVVNFIGLIYSAGAAMALVMMLKERSEAQYKAAALVDPLTGLANRRAFMARAERVLQASRLGNQAAALLAFDLDRFKHVNDTFDHATGDQLLRLFSDVLSRVLRSADISGRIGGEEFVAMLPGCDHQAAMAIAGKVRGIFQDDTRYMNGHRVEATVSVGVASDGDDPVSLAQILARADEALYRAKARGRNRVVSADDAADPVLQKVVRIA